MRNKAGWRKAVLVVGVTCLLGGAVRVASQGSKSSTLVEVKIDNFSFSPTPVTVPVGTTIKWTNHDDIPHTVVSDDKSTFRSKPMDTDETFTYTFTKPGTYTYFCSIHPKMVAKVVVQ